MYSHFIESFIVKFSFDHQQSKAWSMVMVRENILSYDCIFRESKDKLVAKFYKHAWPFRRNKTLMFGFMYIEKGLSWYKKILNLTLPEPRDIKINPKNCIGKFINEFIRGLIILVLKAY